MTNTLTKIVSKIPVSKMNKRSCKVCKKKLKIFEFNLCSCGENVCIKHVNRNLHDCKKRRKMTVSSSSDDLNEMNIKLVKITSPKVDKI